MKADLTRLLGVFLFVAISACGQRKHGRLVSAEAAGEASVASAEESDRARDQALVRVVNAVTGGGPIDVWTDDSPTFTKLGFKSVSSYELLTPNTPTFKVVRTGQSARTPLAEEQAVARDGRFYTVIALASEDETRVELAVIRDDLVPADSTKARIRVINAAARTGSVDVFLDRKRGTLFNDIAVQDDVDFREVEPGPHSLLVRRHKTSDVLIGIDKINLQAGENLTVILTHPSVTSDQVVTIRVLDELAPRPRRGS
jgi:hypothetical protein